MSAVVPVAKKKAAKKPAGKAPVNAAVVMEKIKNVLGLDASAAAAGLEPVRTKKPPVPDPRVLHAGQHVQFESGSIWRVERATESSAHVVCVVGVGPHKKEIPKGDKLITVTSYDGDRPGQATDISSSSAGVKVVPAPEPKGKQVDAAAAPQEDVMKKKSESKATAKVAAAKTPVTSKKKDAAKPASSKTAPKAKGERKHKEFTEAQVAAIKKARKDGQGYWTIGEKYGVSGPVIWRLLNSK